MDTLTCETKSQKRLILAIVQRIFVPIGLLTPATLLPKLLIQHLWKMKIAWDSELSPNDVNAFLKWFRDLYVLKDVTLSRCMIINSTSELHVFVDASKEGMQRASFPLVDKGKKGVGPFFVENRVKEIRQLTRGHLWKHVPGNLNIADLLSRGCSPRQMLISRWWEGPLWLRESPEYWPLGETPGDSEEVELERKKIKKWRGRPRTIYCDNGTNFRGAFNDLSKLNWSKIVEETRTPKILWKFIPPTAAWWGGWWGKVGPHCKELLKRTLGRSVLKYDELYTVLCDCESIINCRPLTYVSENPEELIPLTPSMFLISNKNSNIEDIEELNSNSLNKRIKYRSKLLKDLRQRFRNEYLSQLIQKHNEKESRDPQIGEVVLVGDDNKKRLFWALAKIIELIPGRDGKIRTVRLKTQHGKNVAKNTAYLPFRDTLK
ncbi:integrase catalytic domain-containing protein [Trichonephila clavipes]|nr:integrase catalytic domain-containing protein [Trichonephila clavipes]